MVTSFTQFLVEEEREIYFSFGRMNPPTIGHEKLLEKLSSSSGSNPYRMYKKIYYNDKETDYSNFDLSEFDNTYVKLFVTNKSDEDMYNNLIERIYNTISVHELQIIEDPIDVSSTVRSDILDAGEDTQTFLNNYIDQADTGELDKQKLKQFARELYGEASE